jgi:endonuclease/exonuclease/phosphatase family metal-dependent hydrolase
VIRRGSADVVALQEVDRETRRSGGVDQLQELSELTGMKGIFGKAKDHSGGEFGNAILSRFPIEPVSNVSLPTGLGREPRGALIARIAVPRPEGKPVTFLMLSTHFDFLPGSRVRLASVANIRDVMKEYQDIPCVLAGDMNARPGSDTIAALRRDWSRVRAAEPLPSYPAARPSREIDHLFCRPAARWSAIEVTVLDDTAASDHRALVAKLRLADR